MIHSGAAIPKKSKGIVYSLINKQYYWSLNYKLLQKYCIIYNDSIGGIWDGERWYYTGSVKFNHLVRKYHNVEIT